MRCKNRNPDLPKTFGDEVVHGLNDLLASLKSGKPLTVRDVKAELASPTGYSNRSLNVLVSDFHSHQR